MSSFNPDFLTRDKLIAILLEDQKSHPQDKFILVYGSNERLYHSNIKLAEYAKKYSFNDEEWTPDKFGPAVDVILLS